jgi:Skp family chaperone for outer membrane proteins
MIRHLLILILLGMATAAAAQEPTRPSHVPVPDPHGQGDPQKLFQERLRQFDLRNQKFENLRSELRKHLSEQDVSRLIDMLKQHVDSDDPRIKEQVRKLLEGAKGDRPPVDLTPEQKELIRKTLESALSKVKPGEKLPEVEPGKPPVKPPGEPTPEPIPRPEPPKVNPLDEQARAEAREQIQKWSKQLERWSKKLEDSPELQDALRDIGKSLMEMQSKSLPADERLDAQLDELNRWSKDLGEWTKDSWGSLKKLDLPKMPKMDWQPPTMPEVGPLPSMTLPSLPGLPTGMPSVPGGWQEILVVSGLCLLAVLLWKLAALWRTMRGRDAGGWKLGPWPVDPSQIATREELIRAFEYLSLLHLGWAARHWNHCELAHRLGKTDDRRQAADALARLYELARYAPQSGPLAPDAMAAARRDLCLLAGVSGA